MRNISHNLKLLRHQFAKFAAQGHGCAGGAAAMVMTVALGTGGVWALADKTTDHDTTPQTQTALSGIKSDMDALEPAFQNLRIIEDRQALRRYSPLTAPQLQSAWREKEMVFNEQAVPVLQNILLNPHLSEKQAEDLMKLFAQKYREPTEIHPHFHISDYGFLRETRDDIAERGIFKAPEDILKEASGKIAKRDCLKRSATAVSLLFFLVAGVFAGASVNDSRRIKDWARKKPEKPPRFKH